jgi:hypothetical protein
MGAAQGVGEAGGGGRLLNGYHDRAARTFYVPVITPGNASRSTVIKLRSSTLMSGECPNRGNGLVCRLRSRPHRWLWR